MRETSFIRQNKEKWQEFEEILEDKYKDPEKLNDLFVQITDDLSYSRTFYPNRSVRVYLNTLAQRIFSNIYRYRKSRVGRMVTFWTDELPRLNYEARSEFRTAFLLFVVAVVIGVVSSAMEPEFPRIILGDDYVDMTLRNIESGDPMAVYKEKGAFGMALGITANNLLVDVLTFCLGVFFAIGTAGILISNGIMVGAFQYFFVEKGVFLQTFLTIWLHGTLEMSGMVIAGAAGLTMGKGLVFPGTYSRLQSFQLSARRGLKILIGIFPLTIIAGIIESYLTRYTHTPDLIRGLFILICLVFVIAYYVWYPRYKARVGFQTAVRDTRLPPDTAQRIDFTTIKSSGEMFADCFLLMKKHLMTFLRISLFAAFFYCGAIFTLSQKKPDAIFVFPHTLWGSITVIGQFFYRQHLPWLPVLCVFIFWMLGLTLFRQVFSEAGEANEGRDWRSRVGYLLKSLVATTIVVIHVILSLQYAPITLLFVLPLLVMWAFVMARENEGVFQSAGNALRLIGGNYGQAIILFSLLLSISALFYMFIDTSIAWLYLRMIGWNISIDQSNMDQLLVVLLSFLSMFFISLIYILLLSGGALLYYSCLEAKDAHALRARLREIGAGKTFQGLERE